MKANRITESDIVDVLLGDADPGAEARLREAAQDDPKIARLCAEWNRILPAVKAQTALARTITANARRRAMERLPMEKEALSDAHAARAEGAFGAVSGLLCGLLGPGETGRRAWKVAAAVVVIPLLVAAGAFLYRLGRPLSEPIVVERVSGEVYLVDEKGYMQPLAQGGVVPFPARIRVVGEGQASLMFPDKSHLAASKDADLRLENCRLIRQSAGSTFYRVREPSHRIEDTPFTVFLPQGRIVDTGTEFNVLLDSRDRAVIRVDRGRVRLLPDRGRSIEVAEGRQAFLSPAQAIVEDVVAQNATHSTRPRE